MSKVPEDLVGRVFGRLTVISIGPRKSDNAITWHCICNCGVEVTVRGASLRNGNTKSCGCLSSETATKTGTIHGMSKHPVYRVWASMIQRTTNPCDARWAGYGGRGILCDPTWHEFVNFWEDMGDTYSEGLSLDRINADGNYCKENCRWVTDSLQAHNKRKMSGASSSYIGVNFHKKAGKFRSEIKDKGQSVYLGLFTTEYLAAVAYDNASEQLHGDRPNKTVKEE